MSKIKWYNWSHAYTAFGLKFRIRYSEVKNRIFCSLKRVANV